MPTSKIKYRVRTWDGMYMTKWMDDEKEAWDSFREIIDRRFKLTYEKHTNFHIKQEKLFIKLIWMGTVTYNI